MNFIETGHSNQKKTAKLQLVKMAELVFRPIFEQLTQTFAGEPFSAMYFGRHCNKNLLILKHDLTVMLVFGDDIQWEKPDMIKSVTTGEESIKGIQIVGNDDVILMLDESGNLWRLINAFDVSDKRFESLHSLSNECFYEWASFKKFNFAKVFAVCAMKQGFACIGVNMKSEKKLAILSSLDSPIEEFTFDGLNATDSFIYFLTYLDFDTEKTILKNKFDSTKETLLVSDKLKGRTYLCMKNGKNSLIHDASISLISTLHYLQRNCVVLCFENGKLVFYFYNKPERQCTAFLQRKVVAVGKCCCSDVCSLWTDGISLHHTNFTIGSNSPVVKVSHLKLPSTVISPLSFLQIHNCVLIITINNIYYLITANSVPGTQIIRDFKEILNDINERAQNIDELQKNIDMLSHYLNCKDVMGSFSMTEKMEMWWEGNSLMIKNVFGVCLKHEFWKLRLKIKHHEKEMVHLVDFNFDVSEGMCIRVDNPFNTVGKIKVSLIGNFNGTSLFLDLGEIFMSETNCKKNNLRKCLEKILNKRNPIHIKK